jgi:transposase InsO family protein
LFLWGPVKYVLSDHGTQYTSKKWIETLSLQGISTRISSVYHPETDGQSERSIQMLSDKIMILTLHMGLLWDPVVQMATKAVNNCYFVTTGFHPIKIMDNKRNLRNDPKNEIHINQKVEDIDNKRESGDITKKNEKDS